MKKMIQFGYMLVVCVSLLGCSLPGRDRPGLTIHMVRPEQQGTILPMGVSIQLRAQALAPGGGVRSIRFFVSGLDSGLVSSPTGVGEQANAEVSWTPPAPGEYFIQAEAIRASDSAISEPIRVCVFGEELTWVAYSYGYEGPCTIPPRNPSLPQDGEVTMSAVANPRSLAYNWQGCTTSVASQVLSFTATVDDPADRVAFVIVQAEGPAAALWERVSLIHTSSALTGEKIFTGSTRDLLDLLEIEFGGEVGSVSWTARAIGRSGEFLVEDGPHFIPADACTPPVVAEAMPIVIEPTETLVPSEANCPPGTYFAPVTNKCIAIELPAPGEGDGDGDGDARTCSSYGNINSCSAAGCSWNPNKNACN